MKLYAQFLEIFFVQKTVSIDIDMILKTAIVLVVPIRIFFFTRLKLSSITS